MNIKLVGVLHADGHTDIVDPADFEQLLAAFQKEYEARHGQPPTIVAPAAEGPDSP